MTIGQARTPGAGSCRARQGSTRTRCANATSGSASGTSSRWAQVHDNVRALALGLQALGVRRGGVVMAIGENEPEHFWTEFAAHALGAAVVSLYPDQNTDEITYLAQDSGATVVVAQDQEQVDKALMAAARTSTVEAIVYWDDAGLWNYRDALLAAFGRGPAQRTRGARERHESVRRRAGHGPRRRRRGTVLHVGYDRASQGRDPHRNATCSTTPRGSPVRSPSSQDAST